MKRGVLNQPELRSFVLLLATLIVLTPLLFLKSNVLQSVGIPPPLLMLVLISSLLGSLVEIPLVHNFKTRKPPYSDSEARILEDAFHVPVLGELKTGSDRAYFTTISLNLGFLILLILSIFLLMGLDQQSRLAVALCAPVTLVVTHAVSRIISGVGVVVPEYVAIFPAAVSVLLSQGLPPASAAPIAMASSVIGIGGGVVTTLASLNREKQGSAILSIGGSGSFIPIYLSVLISILL